MREHVLRPTYVHRSALLMLRLPISFRERIKKPTRKSDMSGTKSFGENFAICKTGTSYICVCVFGVMWVGTFGAGGCLNMDFQRVPILMGNVFNF